MKKTSFLSLISFLSLSCLSTACRDLQLPQVIPAPSPSARPSEMPAVSIFIEQGAEIKIHQLDSLLLSVKAKAADGSIVSVPGAITWENDNQDVSNVDESGNLVASSEGSGHIRAHSGDLVSDFSEIKVDHQAITPGFMSISAPMTSFPGPDISTQLNVVAFEGDSETAIVGLKFTYSSSNPSVVSVSADGKLTAHANGSAMIMAHYGVVQSGGLSVSVGFDY